MPPRPRSYKPRTGPVTNAESNESNPSEGAAPDITGVCHVCAEPTSRHCQAICNGCNALFHLALREDIPCKDSGQVGLNEEYRARESVGNACLGAPQAPAPDVPAPKNRRSARREGMGANAVARSRRRIP